MIKLPTFVESQRKHGNSRKTSTYASLTKLKAFDYLDHNKLWKIIKEMGILDHLTSLLRNLYADQEARKPNIEQDWFKIGVYQKGVCQVCILSPSLFYLYAEYINVKCWAG